MIVCPGCKGAKESPAFVDGRRNGRSFGEFRMMPCHTCKGTGEVSPAFEVRHAIGRRAHIARVENHWTLREAADAIGMDVARYSRCEWGIPDSDEDWAKFLGLVETDNQNTEVLPLPTTPAEIATQATLAEVE